MTGLKKQLYYYMRGHSTALLIQFSKNKHWGNLLRLFILHPLYYVQLIVWGILCYFRGRHRFIPIELAGCISGLFFFMRNMNFYRKM
jgi:hypothetical protein